PDLCADAFAAIPWVRGIERVVLSSVVPEKNAVLSDIFGDRLLVVSHELELGVAIDYPEPQTIGADRLANAAAVASLQGAPAVVVDFGTAVTFDIISRAGAYVGGVIAPGLEVMTDYMFQRTALLPKIDLLEPTEIIGKSTRSAMLAGAVHGYRGMIKEILNEIYGEFSVSGGQHPTTIATGGYAELISEKVDQIDAVDPEFTLQGLRIISSLNR
ncbi:MAG: type III pantothenate kinase, partial [Verrucomicrobiales bacterium]